jgi:hypothetical protein
LRWPNTRAYFSEALAAKKKSFVTSMPKKVKSEFFAHQRLFDIGVEPTSSINKNIISSLL